MKHRSPATLLMAGMCALLVRCSGGPAVGHQGGGGSETINAEVVSAGNSITVDVRADTTRYFSIEFYSADYNPFLDTGFFRSRAAAGSIFRTALDSVAAGGYRIIVRDSLSGKTVLFRNVAIPSAEPDTLRDTLCAAASIAGTVVAPASMELNTFVAIIPGSGLWTAIDPAGRFALNGVPAGETVLRVFSMVRNKWNLIETQVILTLDPGTAFDSLVVTINN
jgi:hypothetical protein